MEKKETGRELERVSDLFISSGAEEVLDDKLLGFMVKCADQRGNDFKIEETVNVRKRITYPASKKAQENIRRCLYEHLKNDYTINRVELVKSTEILKLGNVNRKKEEIIIILDPSESH